MISKLYCVFGVGYDITIPKFHFENSFEVGGNSVDLDVAKNENDKRECDEEREDEEEVLARVVENLHLQSEAVVFVENVVWKDKGEVYTCREKPYDNYDDDCLPDRHHSTILKRVDQFVVTITGNG